MIHQICVILYYPIGNMTVFQLSSEKFVGRLDESVPACTVVVLFFVVAVVIF